MTIQEYLEAINKTFKAGISTEHSYRGDLQNLLKSLLPMLEVTNEPSRIDCGAPDYIITRKTIPVGYIEAKDIAKPLDNKAYHEQFTRYKKSLQNLIITDYLEFRLYREGEHITTICLADFQNSKIIPRTNNYASFKDLIDDFGRYEGQTIKSASKLSKMMAAKARLLADVIEKSLTSPQEDSDNNTEQEENNTLKDQLEAFKQILIHDITPKQFADIYAQTIAYGMFAARLQDTTLEDFNRKEAAELIPKTNPFLRKLFQYIAGYDLDSRIVWIVDALADVFKATDIPTLLKDFVKSTQQHDPIIHFYETFLSEYDPALRKSRGVWYTPQPVVNFIVRAVDNILKTDFNLKDGLADNSKTTVDIERATDDKRSNTGYTKKSIEVHKVQFLDPATGTGTFLVEIIREIYKGFEGQEGIWNKYVEEHLIPRLNGFEILMASYSMAHLKLSMLLKETGYKPTKDQRLRVFLTNSLEEYHAETGTLFASWLSHEAHEANYIKRDTPVMVVMGNPPYSGHSSNTGEWISQLLEDYKQEPEGGKLQERNPKWLNDDYVKFIRYGQYFIEKNGEGILAFINNHSFLDNPTFRGMRWHLLTAFNKIYIIDLHGNAKKKEVSPDGSLDQNVFDIMQGVSINIFIKTGNKKKNELAEVFHYNLYGERIFKYDFLNNNNLEDINFKTLKFFSNQYLFIEKDFDSFKKYNDGFAVNELYTINSVGIVTARDQFVTDTCKLTLENRIKDFFITERNEIITKYRLKENSSWEIDKTKRLSKGYNSSFIKVIKYRPFDNRYVYYDPLFIERSRKEVMKNFFVENNISLCWIRPMSSNYNFSIFITDGIIDQCYAGNKSVGAGITYAAPIYIYPSSGNQISTDYHTERIPNLNKKIVSTISSLLRLPFTLEKKDKENSFAPIDILDYIYAVLHSPVYRKEYEELLKIDFPRVPYPKDQKNFWNLVALGSELRQIHLLESTVVDKFITNYPVNGNNVVEKILYNDSKVYINSSQYFDRVPLIAWEFFIGGYQPAQKWLKDRKGRELSFDDVKHYQRVIVALTETDRVMREITTIQI